MTNKKILPAILNLLTGVGGHFYNQRIDRVVLIIAITVLFLIFYFTSSILLSAHLMTHRGALSDNYFMYMSVTYLLCTLSLLIYSAYLGFIDADAETVSSAKISISVKFSALILSLIGGLFVLYQVYISSFLFFGPSALFKTTSTDGKEHDYSSATFSNDSFYWNGYPLKRYDDNFRNTNLPSPPSGDGTLTGNILFNGTPVKGLVFDLVLNGKYRAKGVTTDNSGTFTISIQAGTWHIDFIDPKYWPDKPKDKKLFMLTSREDVLRGNQYNEYKTMEYKEGLPVNVASKKRSKPIIFRIKEKIQLVQPSIKDQNAKIKDYKIQWNSYPNADKYLVKVSKITKEGDTTHFNPISNVVINNATELPLSRLESVPNNDQPAEYEVKVFAFDSAGNFLSKSDDYQEDNTFKLIDGNKLLSDSFKSGFEPGEFNVKDAEQMLENKKRINAVAQLIDDHLYTEAKSLLAKISGKTKPGSKEAVIGYLFAVQNQCDKANAYFDKALSTGGVSCLPKRYRQNCLKSH